MTDRGGPPRLDVVFLGTSGFAAPCLRAVHRAHRVRAVVTQPDRPAGRGRRLLRSEIGHIADELGLPLLQPKRIRLRRSWAPVAARKPDVLVVADYGQILSRRLLAVPRLGAVNVHASLLPRLRGAAPAIWAVARGHRRTGVTTMLMDVGLDTGPILLQRETEITDCDTGGSLLGRLAPIGAEVLLDTLDGLDRGVLRPRPQNDAAATWAPRITRVDAALDWELGAASLASRVRAFSPRPTAFTRTGPGGPFGAGPLRVHAATVGPPNDAVPAPPGSFAVVGSRARPEIAIRCGGEETLRPQMVQAAGRRKMAVADLLRGTILSRGWKPFHGRFLDRATAAANDDPNPGESKVRD